MIINVLIYYLIQIFFRNNKFSMNVANVNNNKILVQKKGN